MCVFRLEEQIGFLIGHRFSRNRPERSDLVIRVFYGGDPEKKSPRCDYYVGNLPDARTHAAKSETVTEFRTFLLPETDRDHFEQTAFDGDRGMPCGT